MHLILLSGGSGKRLWPLSNDVKSKQFLKVLPGPNGRHESMVQRVYRQLQEVGGWDSITVAAGAAQKDQLGLQLGEEVNIVIEPERRDTFPAIALACSYLHSERGVELDEAIAVLPVDPFVELDYFRNISKFEGLIRENPRGLVLMGAAPIIPSEKYGYIIPKSKNNVSEVEYFKEKPDTIMAQALIDKGALWNCGVFGLKISYIAEILKEKYGIDQLDYESIKNSFTSLTKTSFDYEVVERADKITVLKYEGQWKDLGTWETLTEEMEFPLSGKARADNGCENIHVINELGIPIITMGIRNAVVVASRDGILVAEKGETTKLKDFISDFTARPMHEKRRWGEYEVIEHTTYDDGTEALTKKLLLLKGRQISYQYHHNRKEIWTIIRGEGLLYLDGEKIRVAAGDVVKISEKQKHGMTALTNLEIIEVQLGNPLIEEDIVRLEMEW
jgi:mannose-1-phosphate guanylyltransferase